MSNEFYDPLLEVAGTIAEQYGISIADVLALLVQADKDEALVRRSLQSAANSEEARATRSSGRQFDLVEHARTLLRQAKSKSSAAN